jgi:TatD DNase family protein
MQLFDTHAHLQDPAFDDLDAVLERAQAAGVAGIALCGYDPEANEQTLRMATSSPMLYPAVGFHPHEAKDITPALLADLESQAQLPEVVAIGEIGLDFFHNNSPHDDQRRVLDAQLAIALRVAKPISVHSRGAEEDAFEQLTAYATSTGWTPGSPPVGVMHCFGGSLEQARRYTALGFLISLACVITYPANAQARKIAADLPLETLVVETDSPYLPPQSMRGKRNEPASVASALEALAQARGISLERAAEATTRNAERLFRVGVTAGASRI